MKRGLYSKELSELFDKFVREMYRLNRADNPKFICRLVIKWTRGQLLLTKKLLQYLLEAKRRIALGQEAAVVEKIVRTRLIKEFKHDELTLPIRKLLYAQDLVRLLTRTGGRVDKGEQAYLSKLQREFGLSNQQCQQIKEQYLRWQLSILKVNEQSNSLVRIEPESDRFGNSYQDLIELIENSPIYEELIADSQPQKQLTQSNKVKRFFNHKFWWIGISISLLLLIFRQINWQESSPIVTADNVKLTNSCSTTIASPQISLGTKILSTADTSQSDSQMNLYQATTALANCEYEVAQTKFQQALNLDPGNPEALIYLNNTKAMLRGARTIASNNINYYTSNNFKIAVTVPLDSQPEIAREILQGVAKAQTQINRQGGINSKSLLVEIVNLPPQLDTASQVVRELTADQSVLAVIGHDSGKASLAIPQIYQKEGLVMISPTSTDTNLSELGDRIFRTAPNLSSLANTLYSYTVVKSLNKIAVCADSSDSDSSFFAKKFVSKIESEGGEIVTLNCDLAQKNFNPLPLVEQAIAEDADAILLAPGTDSIERAISIAQVNKKRLALLGNHTLYTNKTVQAGTAVEKMVLATPWLPTNPTQLWDIKVNWRTAMSYDATLAIIHGLKQANNRQELQAVLNDPSFTVNGATGKIQFADDNKTKVRLAYIDKLEPSKQYQFLPLKIDN